MKYTILQSSVEKDMIEFPFAWITAILQTSTEKKKLNKVDKNKWTKEKEMTTFSCINTEKNGKCEKWKKNNKQTREREKKRKITRNENDMNLKNTNRKQDIKSQPRQMNVTLHLCYVLCGTRSHCHTNEHNFTCTISIPTCNILF